MCESVKLIASGDFYMSLHNIHIIICYVHIDSYRFVALSAEIPRRSASPRLFSDPPQTAAHAAGYPKGNANCAATAQNSLAVLPQPGKCQWWQRSGDIPGHLDTRSRT